MCHISDLSKGLEHWTIASFSGVCDVGINSLPASDNLQEFTTDVKYT